MNIQTIIQRLIRDNLIEASVMYANNNELEKIYMLAVCATDKVITFACVNDIAYELTTNKAFYIDKGLA